MVVEVVSISHELLERKQISVFPKMLNRSFKDMNVKHWRGFSGTGFYNKQPLYMSQSQYSQGLINPSWGLRASINSPIPLYCVWISNNESLVCGYSI